MSEAALDLTRTIRHLLKSKLAGWRRCSLYPYRPMFGDWRFWVVQVLIIAVAAFHDMIEAGGLPLNMGLLYFVPISLFVVPVVYAAVNFGSSGSIATALWITVINTPNWSLFHHGSERVGVIFQLLILMVVAVFLGRWVDKERSARQQLETAGAQLKASETKLRAYAAYMIHAQEVERQRIARELHDETVQQLVLLCRQLDRVEEFRRTLPSPEAAGLGEARRTAEEVVKWLRDFAKDLRPSILDELGVVASIRRLLVDFKERTGIECQLKVVGEDQWLPPDRELGLFRIAQEALRNVERHAEATQVSVAITFAKHEAILDVADNGVGFIVPPVPGDFTASGQLGLIGMQERAKLLNGKLEIQSSPGNGTRVTASIPI